MIDSEVQSRAGRIKLFLMDCDGVLTDGRIGAEEAAWLRQWLLADGMLHDEGRKFLHELKGEAKQVSPEFDVLFAESMKQPPEQHTCG